MDSGSSCGEISGHAKVGFPYWPHNINWLQAVTAVAVRHQRPFRAVSGSDDNSLVFHNGVPFKYDKMISTHSRFVRDVAYSPNGDLFASVASDGKLFFYDGKTGEVKGEAARNESSSLVSYNILDAFAPQLWH
jgi:WD40 repeat protein